ncbi:Inositol-tetrakisphosphate 1-kinase [Corchorus capsularis]|uniref:inositol-1,3,4-trisphosphate 5/6-kinase n=1 Tax=Corchorus capsularis TaxID=210143 RepID=A0A1R3IDN9_COCAP|nr:Inositol-tetrakisphosphate 1-kinase [Corchorus capsularis]
MGGIVKGVVVDHALLQFQNGNGDNNKNPIFLLLRKLRFSNIRAAISYELSLPAELVNLLQSTAELHSLECLPVSASSLDIAPRQISLAWPGVSGTILYLLPNCNASPSITCISFPVAPDVDITNSHHQSNMIYMDKLEELPLTICRINKQAISNNVVTVGYVMKPSREEDFAKRGAFPLCPTPNGLIFFPLTFELPISTQLEEADAILHKATDEIVSIELNSSSEPSYRITYTTGMQELQRYIESQSHCIEVDPLNSIYPVLDRLKILQILLGLEDLSKEGCCKIRAPHFLKVNDFNEPDLVQRLQDAKLSLPSIVKPQVACGVAESHSMAIVFRVEDFKGLSVPVPAIIQEYVDHSSTLFKFYVLGEEVFHAVKKSIPNADILMKSSERTDLRPLLFDSLKSLPTATGNQHSGCENLSLDLGLVKEAAEWLRRMLGLNIFGFDVVIQEGSSDHVIVDVNYLPSFKEVPDEIAIPTFWDAIKKKVKSNHKQ